MMLNAIRDKVSQNKAFVGINFVFLTLYSLICFVNHANYRTYALDLGAYTRALYDYAHFHASYGEVFRASPENILSDHFDLLLMIFSPLWWIFGSLTLLIVQLIAICFGSWGVYKLAQENKLTKTPAVLATTSFLAYFGIFSAVAFDYHSSVVAACMLPWFVLFFQLGENKKTILVFIFILIAKENMALWMFFICSALLWIYRKIPSQRKTALGLSIASLFFFIAIIFYVMPFFSPQKAYSHIEFHVLGNNFKEIILNILQHPVRAFSLLFQNHLPDASLNYIKTETWIFWLISGGFLLISRPVFLWMVLPVMLQKMYHDDPAKWSVAQQYNIEFAPLLAWCLIETIKNKTNKTQTVLSAITLGCCVAVTIRLCDNTVGFVDKTRIRFYQADHYKSDFNKEDLNDVLRAIPKDVIVSAQSMFVPHLIDKKAVYQYPIVKNAGYILLSNDIHAYPLTPKTIQKQIDSLLSSKTTSTACVKKGIYLFKIQANALY
ncbi:MAG TPA: DUF2079 domain-containing protein [Bacteroidia bacterium]|jgi:uncharacterized membrane protein|nr:DUF2079 domain-containing protein [Bacteroidia bacterium]